MATSIISKCSGKGNIDVIIEDALKITAHHLKFTMGTSEVDPNKLIKSNYSNCVGYATFFSAVCNYLIFMNSLSGEWIAKPKTAEIYFLNINVHKYFSSAFFKNHDVVIIENIKTGELLAVDPTLYDYGKVKFIGLKY
ncbi:hypothetical protein [Salinimicrobium sediminilitoris]|uniref:hypothetical protein n=1 Tax=Salinimicrobium sediminilitoris TaxID=2876715 RepID=UPI001E464FA1|nr:hypothetical protein [Salinimicrobium sediminilitoris]MCC8361003.1 hypothetical protein [Salinimicrobium sediminilitoris]